MVRIIALNPYSVHVAAWEELENNNIYQNIMNLIDWVKTANQYVEQRGETVSRVQIQVYDGLPLDFYCGADDKVYIGPYIPDILSGSMVTYMLDYNSEGGRWYSDLFERIWARKISTMIYFASQSDGSCNPFVKEEQRACLHSVRPLESVIPIQA